ncbi:MAG: Gfo/Idh/MocA family oxidoreductase [Saprospiraceae bacterium]|nr:Gfo/Idh/MocA family oxidoreductase [Saprospiraceae bacterium]HPG05366.1 Gfo/Idh/MocA family oxidoreductase [Saprospiraceae bacterium]
MKRRNFLKTTGLGAGLFTIVPRHVLGKGWVAPSDQLTKAIIGVGGMGTGHIQYEGRLVAICDVDANHLAKASEIAGPQVKTFHDFRELLALPEVDVVHIATPPHWHGLISIAAARAGKDVWCEKPMTRTIGEGQAVIRAIQEYGRMFRLNTWFRFESNFYGMGVPVAPIKKLVDSGVFGWPLKVTLNAATGFNWKFYWQGKTNLVPEPVPAELDYDFWLGPASYKPYHPHRVHGSFRGYWDYDGGGLGDMGQHYLDPVQFLLKKDDESPVTIEIDAPQQHYDAVGTWRRITYTYADGCQIVLDGANDDIRAPFLEGPGGKLYPGLKADNLEVDKLLAYLPDPPPVITKFSDAVRSRRKFALNEMNGHRSCTLVNLGKIALRLGRDLTFDSSDQRFIDDPGANALLDQPMRGKWKMEL